MMLLAGLVAYWIVSEFKSHQEKPKTESPNILSILQRIVAAVLYLFLFWQLMGHDFFGFKNMISNKLLGFVLIIFAVGVSVAARRELAANWTDAAEYQIKKDQKLVTTGIYSYIRHPIYLGVTCTFLGVQLLVGSYLLLFFMIVIPLFSYFQAKREEKMLVNYFGKEYEEYKMKTQLFLPYLL